MKRKRAAVLKAPQYQESNVIKLVDKTYQKRPRVQIYPKNLNQESYLLKLNDSTKMIIFAMVQPVRVKLCLRFNGQLINSSTATLLRLL